MFFRKVPEAVEMVLLLSDQSFSPATSQVNTGQRIVCTGVRDGTGSWFGFSDRGSSVQVNGYYEISSRCTQQLKKTYRKLKISQETSLIIGFLAALKCLI